MRLTRTIIAIIAYRRNKNLGDLIGSKRILDCKVVRKNYSKKQLTCRLYLIRRDDIFCRQVLKTDTYTSYRTGKTFKTFHEFIYVYIHEQNKN